MNFDQSKELLAYISAGVDNRTLSVATAGIWADLLCDVDLDDAKAAVRVHVLNPQVKYLDVKEIIRLVKVATRQTPEAIDADVRSAKTRGLIGDDWPRNRALPSDVARRLAAAREQWAREVEALEARPIVDPVSIDVGPVGREVPDA